MSTKLEIRLDRPEGIYHAGEPIHGTVIIHDSRYLGSNLQLTREWRTEGSGNLDKSSRVVIPLEQPWGSRRQELPFSFVAPNGPFSYLGSVVNVDWYLRIEAGGLLNSTHNEIDFFLDPVANMTEVDLGNYYKEPRENLHSKRGRQVGFGCFYIIACLPYFALVFAITILNAPLEFTVPVGLLLTGLYGFVGFHWYKKTPVSMRLGDKIFQVSPLDLHRSENLEVNFSSKVTREVSLERIELHLRQMEYAHSGSKNKERHATMVHNEVFILLESTTLQANQNLELKKIIKIPDAAAITFKSFDNSIVWFVELIVIFSGHPHPAKYFQEITVRP